MKPSIFTKIINGDIPCHKVYEDDVALAFMDIAPITPGMVVVVPKQQIPNLEDIADAQFQQLMLVVKKMMRALKKSFPGNSKIAVKVEGMDVADHAHVVLFPINSAADFNATPSTNVHQEELSTHAKLIRSNL